MSDLTGAAWRTSTRSGSEGNCVEVATNLAGVVGIRDTKDRGAGPVLAVPRAGWATFIAATRAGRFDRR